MDHSSETRRLAALSRLEVLDTAREPLFDSLTEMAARVCDTPTALISLVDANRQWFKGCIGIDATETPRDIAFCDHAIRSDAVMIVPDATKDARFCDNPLVTGELGIRFYAGAPLITPEGHRLGTLCVIDYRPRRLNAGQTAELQALAASVMQALVMRMKARETERLAIVAAERETLLESAERLAHVGTWSLDARTQAIHWSEEVYRIHGLDPALPPPPIETALGYFHPDDIGHLTAVVEQALARGEGYEYHGRLIRTDGAVRHVISHGSCRRGHDGELDVIFGTFQDVTELKLADAAVRESEARYRLLAHNSTDVIACYDRNAVLTFLSPALATVLGYAPEELIGKKTTSIIHPDDVASVMAGFSAYIAAGACADGFRIEYRAFRKDGRMIWLEAHPKANYDPTTGEITEIQDVVRDISDRKALEAELAAARDEALAAAAVKSEFLANMSHEIRTPLTAILGFSGLLSARTDLADDARLQVQRMEGASSALLAIVNDILDFSKLEAGQIEIKPRAVRPIDLAHDVLAMFTPQADAKSLSLALAMEGDAPGHLSMDPDRLRQILLNLVGNAIKFTAEGGVRLVMAYAADESRLEFRVEDTGPGLTAPQRRKLFQRFSQVDASSTRRHGGTGLGLAICKGLAEAMGGDIGVDSTPGQGSTFHFSIAAPPAEAPAEREAGAEPVEGLRLLVADDNPVNREIAQLILQQLGMEVCVAASGEEAVASAKIQPFDVILLDVRMPGLDGPGALARIRAEPGPNRDVPVLAFTADASDDCVDQFGFDGICFKPMVASDIALAIANAVRWDDAPFETEEEHATAV